MQLSLQALLVHCELLLLLLRRDIEQGVQQQGVKEERASRQGER